MVTTIVPLINGTYVVNWYRMPHYRPAFIAEPDTAVELDALVHQGNHFGRDETELDLFVCKMYEVQPWPVEDRIWVIYVVNEIVFVLIW